MLPRIIQPGSPEPDTWWILTTCGPYREVITDGNVEHLSVFYTEEMVEETRDKYPTLAQEIASWK